MTATGDSDKAAIGSGTSAEDEKSPTDQLIDLLVYAPVGLIYEYEDVLEQVVKRGRSQVQLAKLFSKMAAQQASQGSSGATSDSRSGGGGPEREFFDAVNLVADTLAKGITEFGAAIGLAPPKDEASTTAPSPEHSATEPDDDAVIEDAELVDDAELVEEAAPTEEPTATSADEATESPLPIAGYDELKAKEIVQLLPDLDRDQRARIRAHEEANRARKTVLARLDSLDN